MNAERQTAPLADVHYITPGIAIDALTAWSIMGGYGARRTREDLRGTYEAVFRDAVETGKVTLLWYGLWTPVNPDKALVGDEFAKDAYLTVEELHRWLCTFAQDAGTFSWSEWWAWMEANRWYEWATASDTATAPAEAETANRKGPGRPGLPKVTHELACRVAEAEFRRAGKCPIRKRMIQLLAQETGRKESTVSGTYQHGPIKKYISSLTI